MIFQKGRSTTNQVKHQPSLQVWSYHPSNALKPPKTGWSIPWDGPVGDLLTRIKVGMNIYGIYIHIYIYLTIYI
jgi:hypothetical protein